MTIKSTYLSWFLISIFTLLFRVAFLLILDNIVMFASIIYITRIPKF